MGRELPRAIAAKFFAAASKAIVRAWQRKRCDSIACVLNCKRLQPSHGVLSVILFGLVTFCGTAITFATPVISSQSDEPQRAVHADESRVDFDTQVMAVFTRYGCNAAQCHGAASGQNGFRLSLFGGDAEFDYRTIAQEGKGRRVYPAKPDRSLLVQKAMGEMAHGGGELISSDSEAYHVLTTWIRQGADRNSGHTLVEIQPRLTNETTLKVGDRSGLSVTASFRRFTDGNFDGNFVGNDGESQVDREKEVHEVDVSAWAVAQSLDESAIELSPGGSQLTVHRPGTHFVLVRYLTQTNLLQIDVPFGPAVDRESWDEFNWIDVPIHASWSQMGLVPPPLARDETLFRRLHLTLTGRLPDPDSAANYIADSTPDKYVRLVDELLASEAFVDLWSAHISDWFRVGVANDVAMAAPFHDWIREQVRQDTPLDQMAERMLMALGSVDDNPAVAFYSASTDPRRQAEQFGQVWLSVRLRCAECHNHPLDRWTQDDYYSLAAMFDKLDYRRPLGMNQVGGLINPRTGQKAIPRIESEEVSVSSPDPRVELARWLTSEDNPYFADSIVNRVFGLAMGRAFFEPVDDFRRTNPSAQADLKRQMATKFRKGEYRLRPLMREIVLSATWQRSTEIDMNDPQSPWLLRFHEHRLPAVVLLDAICRVTGTPLEREALKDEKDRVERAVRLVLPQTEQEVVALGGCDRSEGCDAVNREPALTTAAALELINGQWINQRLLDPDGRLAKWLNEGWDDESMLEQIYRLAYARSPRAVENEYWLAVLQEATSEEDRRQMWQDLVWSILASREFVTNH